MSNKRQKVEVHECAKFLYEEMGKYLCRDLIDMITLKSRFHASVAWKDEDIPFRMEIWYPCCDDCKTQQNATLYLMIDNQTMISRDPLQEVRRRTILTNGQRTERLELHFLNSCGKCTILSKPDEFLIELPDGRTATFHGKAADEVWEEVLDHLDFCKSI